MSATLSVRRSLHSGCRANAQADRPPVLCVPGTGIADQMPSVGSVSTCVSTVAVAKPRPRRPVPTRPTRGVRSRGLCRLFILEPPEPDQVTARRQEGRQSTKRIPER